MTGGRWWRPRLAFLLLSGLTLLPLGAFLLNGLTGDSAKDADVLTRPFLRAVGRSVTEAGILALAGFAVGWPVGTLFGLQRPKTEGLLLLLLFPMAVPPFLWALAVQGWRPWLQYSQQWWLDGFPGVLIALAPLTIPMPLLAAWLSTRCLSSSCIESLWLAGGARPVLAAGLACSRGPAGAAALVAAALVFSDAGCDQIMGCHGFSSEILIAFAARFDFGLASAKATMGAALLIPLALLTCWLLSRHFAALPLGQAIPRSHTPVRLVPSMLLTQMLGLLVLALVFMPLLGLLLPLVRDPSWLRVLGEAALLWQERAGSTLLRPLAAVLMATSLGFALAAVTQPWQGERWLLVAATLLVAIPSVLGALGWVWLVGMVPKVLGPVQDSGWLVGVCSGTRLAPLVGFLVSMGLRNISQSARDAARLFAVPRLRWYTLGVLPVVGPCVIGALTVVVVLTCADMHAELLLQPPGEANFSAHLYAVMDNSSASRVAALSLLHLCPLWAILGGTLVAIGAFRFRRS